MGNQIKISLISATESTIYLEVEANADKLDAGKTVQVTDGGTQQEAFILGRIGNRYALAQTALPLSLRQGMRMPCTTAVTITRGEDRTAWNVISVRKAYPFTNPVVWCSMRAWRSFLQRNLQAA